MTFAEYLIIGCVTVAVFLTSKIIELYANRREPEPPDRGGLPSVELGWIGRYNSETLKSVYPLGMHYAPTEPIVPKRRKPRLGGKGLHRLLIGVDNREQYIFVFPANAKPSDVLMAAQEWSENPGLSFDGHCEDGVMELLIMRDSMMK